MIGKIKDVGFIVLLVVGVICFVYFMWPTPNSNDVFNVPAPVIEEKKEEPKEPIGEHSISQIDGTYFESDTATLQLGELKFISDGEIYWKEKKIETDKELVTALRELVSGYSYISGAHWRAINEELLRDDFRLDDVRREIIRDFIRMNESKVEGIQERLRLRRELE